MLLPSKHIKVSDSIITVAGLVLSVLDHPMSLDVLWKQYCLKGTQIADFEIKHNFTHFYLSICFLYATSAIDLNESGLVYASG